MAIEVAGEDLDAILARMIPPHVANTTPNPLSMAVIGLTRDLENKTHSESEVSQSEVSNDYTQQEYDKHDSRSLPDSFHNPVRTVFNPCHKFASHFVDTELAGQELVQSSFGVDIPYNLHIFPRSTFQSTHIPILACTDADNIVPLVASLVCLYHTWQISAPVIGLQISQFDGKVAVYIGYMRPINDSEKLVRFYKISNHIKSKFIFSMFKFKYHYLKILLCLAL